jgi:hypothetical protein
VLYTLTEEEEREEAAARGGGPAGPPSLPSIPGTDGDRSARLIARPAPPKCVPRRACATQEPSTRGQLHRALL